jgi:hypothetical protein
MKKEPTLEQKMAKLEEDGDPLVVGDENPLPSLKSIEAIDDHKVLLDICKRHGLPTSGNAAQKRKAICDQITPTCLIRQLGSRDCNLVNKARTQCKRACKCVPIRMRMAARGPNHTDLPN